MMDLIPTPQKKLKNNLFITKTTYIFAITLN